MSQSVCQWFPAVCVVGAKEASGDKLSGGRNDKGESQLELA